MSFSVSRNQKKSIRKRSTTPSPMVLVGSDEEWVKAAMTDDALVVELLVRLNGTPTTAPQTHTRLEWSVRQRRSKSLSLKNKAHSHRASPTTPLSWNRATSLSGCTVGSGSAGRGHKESCGAAPAKLYIAGSKLHINGDGEKANSKRSTRKKTLVQLKDEESSLIKERRELKREITNLSMHLEKQRATHDKLKRLKFELQPLLDQQTSSEDATVESASCRQDSSSNGATKSFETNAFVEYHAKFVLPDLNIPFAEEVVPRPDVICGLAKPNRNINT